MSTIDLYFIVMMKSGEVLYPTHGPFLNEDMARDVLLGLPKILGSCYQYIAVVKMNCELAQGEE